MRYKRGSKVEVLNQIGAPSGSWHGAEIISRNGRTYAVRYDVCAGRADEPIVNGVSRKFIRPSPPAVDVSENWVPGDIVEVFDNFCWKMATISKVFGRGYFLVRLLGSMWEFKVNKVQLRARLSWQDNTWFVVGTGSRRFKRTERSRLKPRQNLNCSLWTTESLTNTPASNDYIASEEQMHAPKSKSGFPGNVKRRQPLYDSPVEACRGATYKLRKTEKYGRHERVVAADPTPLPEKVDIVAPSTERHKHASLNVKTTRFSDIDEERLEPYGVFRSSFAIGFDPDDADSRTCSVGSCSVSGNGLYNLRHRYSTVPIEDTDDSISDAESACGLNNEGHIPFTTKEDMSGNIHSLELQAYRCTIEALHALGPLTWEQESLMTDLRISLHISNDEQIMELRNLVSSNTGVRDRC